MKAEVWMMYKPWNAEDCQKPGRSWGSRLEPISAPTVLRETPLDLGVLASRSLRQYTCVVKATQFEVLYIL